MHNKLLMLLCLGNAHAIHAYNRLPEPVNYTGNRSSDDEYILGSLTKLSADHELEIMYVAKHIKIVHREIIKLMRWF